MTINSKSNAQYTTLFNKARQLSSAIYTIRMRRQDATLVYNCYYIASIGYTLAATKLSLIQCNSIQSPVICTNLNDSYLPKESHITSPSTHIEYDSHSPSSFMHDTKRGMGTIHVRCHIRGIFCHSFQHTHFSTTNHHDQNDFQFLVH
jgi:hypothetical protein